MVKIKEIYVCEVCGKEFDKQSDADCCEYEHMGFRSDKQIKEWEYLKEKAKMASFVVSEHHNPDTLDEYDKAVEELVKFE